MKCLCKPGPKMSIHTKMQMKLQSGTYSANKPSLCASQCSPIRTLRGRKFQHCEHCFLSRNRGQSRLIKATSRSYGADDYGSKSPPSQKIVRQKQPSVQNAGYSGVFWLLFINFAVFVADHVLHLASVTAWLATLVGLSLASFKPAALRAVAVGPELSILCSNVFMLYVFGRIVEEEEGTFGVWATYCLCALGASIASVLMQPRNVVSLGASGAVFGLFTVSVLLKLSFSFRKLLECVILGQFVFQQLIGEAQMQSRVWAGGQGLKIAGTQVGHLAHLAGAFAGVLLVLLLSRLPAAEK